MPHTPTSGKIGAVAKHLGPDHPDLARLRAELKAEHAERLLAELATLPALTDDRRRELARLIAPVEDTAADGAA